MNDLRTVLEAIGVARRRNFEVYAQLAALTDAAAVGFVQRTEGADVTLKLIEAALHDAPEQARALLGQIADNDHEVVGLTRFIAAGFAE